LGGFEVEKEGITLIELRVDNGDSKGRDSFKVDHGSDAAEVTNVHEAGAREVGDEVGEREMGINSNTKIANK